MEVPRGSWTIQEQLRSKFEQIIGQPRYRTPAELYYAPVQTVLEANSWPGLRGVGVNFYPDYTTYLNLDETGQFGGNNNVFVIYRGMAARARGMSSSEGLAFIDVGPLQVTVSTIYVAEYLRQEWDKCVMLASFD